MKKLIHLFKGRPCEAEQLIGPRLREQARQIPASAPAGSRRRVLDAVAQIVPPSRNVFTWRWIAACASVITALVIAALTFRPHSSGEIHQTPGIAVHDNANLRISLPTADEPAAMVERCVEEPLQNQFRQLMSDLDQSTETVRSVLPSAPTKHTKDSSGKAHELNRRDLA